MHLLLAQKGTLSGGDGEAIDPADVPPAFGHGTMVAQDETRFAIGLSLQGPKRNALRGRWPGEM